MGMIGFSRIDYRTKLLHTYCNKLGEVAIRKFARDLRELEMYGANPGEGIRESVKKIKEKYLP